MWNEIYNMESRVYVDHLTLSKTIIFEDVSHYVPHLGTTKGKSKSYINSNLMHLQINTILGRALNEKQENG